MAQQPGTLVRGRQGAPVLRSSNQSFTFHGRTMAAFRAPPYAYPPGYHHHAFGAGELLPVALLIPAFFIIDYSTYGLPPPPYGDAWVRVGPDAVLVDTNTNQVLDTAQAVFAQDLPPANQDGGPNAGMPRLDPYLPPEFSTGAFRMNAGDGACDRFYRDPSFRDGLDGAWRAQDWNGVARSVVELRCDTDLSWYLLGVAAQGLGLNQAATTYYNSAIAVSMRDRRGRYTLCSALGGDACRGVDIANQSRENMQLLVQGGQ